MPSTANQVVGVILFVLRYVGGRPPPDPRRATRRPPGIPPAP